MTVESVSMVTCPPNEGATGIGTYAAELSKELERRGIQVKPYWYNKKEVKVFGKNFGGVLSQYFARFQEPPQADVLHATFSNFTNKHCDVITMMDLIWRRGGYPEARVLNNIYKKKMRNSVVLCPSRAIAQECLGWLGGDGERIVVTPLAADKRFFLTDFKDDKTIDILMVGDANERKRTLESIRALEGMKGLRICHVGRPLTSSPYGSLCVEEAKKRGVEVEEIGQVSVDALAELYGSSRLLLYPSTDEGFGLPPLEAAASGLTSVVGSHPVLREVMGSCAKFCDGKSPESIRQAINEVLSDGSISRSALVSRAASFSWSDCASKTLEAYELAMEL